MQFPGTVIGQFNDSYAPVADGCARVVEQYARWLDETYGPTCVVAPRFPGYHGQSSFPVHRFASLPTLVRYPYRIGIPWLDPTFARRVRQIAFRLVHVHCPFAAASAARIAIDGRRIPLVASFHTKYRDDLERLLPRPMVDYLLRKVVDFYQSADEVWTPSKGSADTLRDYGYRGPIAVVPNGSDLYLAPGHRAAWAAEAELELGIEPDEVVLAYVGQHVWQKNLRLLIEAMGHLQRAGVAFRLLMIGEGASRQELEALAAREGLSKHVQFLGVVLDRERLKRLYARTALFLFPSQYDTGSLVIREAAGCGTASLLVTPSIISEVIRDGVNGFTAPNDPAAYANRIREILGQPGLIARAGAEAQRSIYRSWRQIIEQEVMPRYDDLLRIRRRRAA